MNTQDSLALLMDLISTPSHSKEEDKSGDLIYNKLAVLGFTPERIKNNVWAFAQPYNSKLPTLLLNSHHDTVKPGESWTLDPYTPMVIEDKLIGLGSNDAGASLVCLLAAFVQLKHSKLPFNLVFLASAEEEISGVDGASLAFKHLPKIDFAIVGEPTDCQLAIAEKGLMVIDAFVKGKSGHAARDTGENAIYKAVAIIEKIKGFCFPKKSAHLGPIKLSVTQINAGTQHNVIPDACHLVIDVRTTDAYSNADTLAILQKELDCELKARSTRLNASGISVEHPLFLAAEKCGLDKFCSPTLSDQALMDWPSVKIGPGSSPRSHSPDEFIYLHELEQGIATYIKYIEALAQIKY